MRTVIARQARGARPPRHEGDKALLRALWVAMSPPTRRLAGVAACAALAAATAELYLLSMLHTFLRALAMPAEALSLQGALLAGGAVLAAFSRIWVVRQQDAWALGLAAELGVGLFRTALEQSVCGRPQAHAAELFAGLEKTQALVNGALAPLASGLLNMTIGLGIVCYLAWLTPALLAAVALAVGGAYALVHRVTRRRLRDEGERVRSLSGLRMRAAHEMQHGLREVVLAGAEERVTGAFRGVENALREAKLRTRMLVQAPRHIVEAAILLGVIAILATWGSAPGGLAAMIPVAGALAVGGQRLVPLIHQGYLAWGTFHGSAGLLGSVLAQIAPPSGKGAETLPKSVVFARELRLQGVVYAHPGRKPVLQGIDLNIPRGARIGIRGATGSGKSTLLDVIVGLAVPQQGLVTLDGQALDTAEWRRGWMSSVAYVPQHIYLPDAPLREVIAFPDAGAEIDDARVAAVIERARLDDLVAVLPDGLESRLGDFGVRLSGGQRQRVAIARALYRKAQLLVLDEATGQLDEPTEREVLAGLAALGRELTVIVVAHRPAALAHCDVVYELRNGRLLVEGGDATAEQAP